MQPGLSIPSHTVARDSLTFFNLQVAPCDLHMAQAPDKKLCAWGI